MAPDNTPGERVKSSAPVIDLTARVDALEEQLQALTGQTEQNAYQLRELEKQFTTYKAEMDKKLAAPATAETAALAPAVTRTPTTTAPARKPAEKPAAHKSDASRPPAHGKRAGRERRGP